jgi:TP901 family phage tail tape measure protein
MAENNLTTYITANADFSSLRTQLAAVTAQLIKLQETTVGTNAKLGNQIAVMNKAFSETLRSTGQFSTHFVSLSSDVQKFGKNLDSGQLKLNQYFKAWQGHTKNTGNLIKDLAKQQVMLEQAIVQPLGKNAQGLMQYNIQVAKGLDVIKNKTALARQEASIMNKVMQDGATGLINWGKNTQWAGRQLTVGLTVPLAAFGMAAQKAFLDANTEMVRLTKVYGGLAATSSATLAKVQKDVSETAKAMASNYGVAYKDTIALAADLAATGKEGNDLIASTTQTTRLAVLGEIDRQSAMKATLAIQNTFKQNTDDLTKSIDFLNAVENQTSTSLQDLTDAIPKAGPVIQAMGGSVKDLALYLTAMKEGGIDASSGANALKSALASLVNPTKVAKDMFTGFGIDLGGIVTKNAGNLTDTILGLQTALDSLDPLKKQQAIEQLFGKFQFARMNALFANLGKQGSQTLKVMDLMKASSQDLANVSSRELNMMTESASGKYKRALASVQADLASVGKQFLTISTYVLRVVDGIVKFFDKLPAPIKSVLGFVGGLTAIAGPLIMLTGVLGNFVGYVIKGVFHLKSLIKGGQGFKLLTPEIIAAMEAGKGLQSTFYNDAEATNVLTAAVDTLTQSFNNLEMKANAAKVAMNPAISTVAGSVISAGKQSGRVVDKNSPLIGKPYSRQMSHMIPAGTPQMGSIFGVVPNPGPVNVRIGKNPQAYMGEDLPKIPGASSINGISTGVVASEAAKWHAMTGALAMQSESEIKVLKAEVAATGTITAELAQSYQALLPEFTTITELAASETKSIVAQLQASKITVDQARAQIIALNGEIEAMLASSATQVATTMGRTVNLTTVPLTGQPAVTATGKSNMKELFHKGPTASIVDKIARALGGVRTSGAGYSVETTKPTGLNAGGKVYNPSRDGNVVPGSTSIKYDNTPAILHEGGFILNQDASKNNPDLVSVAKNTRNSGGKVVPALVTPGETYFTPEIASQIMPTLEKANSGSRIQLKTKGGSIQATAQAIRSLFTTNRPSYRKQILALAERRNLERAAVRERDSQFVGNYGTRAWLTRGASTRSVLDEYIKSLPAGQRKQAAKLFEEFSGNVRTGRGGMDKGFARDTFAIESGHLEKGGSLDKLLVTNKLPSLNLENITHATHLTQASVKNGKRFVSRYTVDFDSRSNLQANHGTLIAQNFLERNMTRTGKYDRLMQQAGVDKSNWVTTEQEIDAKIQMLLKGKESKKIGDEKGDITFSSFIPLIDSSIIAAGGSAVKLTRLKRNSVERKNAGGIIGGMVRPGKNNYGKLPSWIIRNEKVKSLGNTDPAHGVLQIGRYQPAMHVRNQYIAPKIRYRGSFQPFTMDKGPTAGKTSYIPRRENAIAAFETGTIETRAKTALYNYMQGDYQAINDPAVQAYLSTIRTKFSGTLHRGVRNPQSLPPVIANLIKEGRWSELVGKEFIMRRSSWSKNPDTAEGFGQLQMVASVKNRNAVPASEIFPDLTFHSPSGPIPVNESEVYMGGKFRVVAASKNKLKLEAVVDGKREMGGVVGAGKSYLVGEKGPELFVPRNSGGIIPNYALGGRVHSGKNNYGMLGQLAILAAMQQGTTFVGSKVGGTAGTAINSMGSILPFLAMNQGMGGGFKSKLSGRMNTMPGFTEKLPAGMEGPQNLSKMGAQLTKTAESGGVFRSSLAKAAMGLTRFNLITAGVVTALIVANKVWRDHQKFVKTNADGYALSAAAADKAGLKYRSYNSIIKDTVQNAKDQAERNKLVYQSMADSGTPLNLTIEQYKKLKTEVKSTYKEQIAAINQANGNDATLQIAIRLKEQLVAAGMSAEEATKKIYTMFQMSNKAGLAVSATTGNPAFRKITDANSASISAINTYEYATKKGSKGYQREGSAQAAQFQTAMQSIEGGIQARIDASEKAAKKDLTGKKQKLTYLEAEKQQLDFLNQKLGKQSKITETTIKELAKTNPEIRKIVTTSDTLVSVWGKLRLSAAGFAGDLTQLNAKQVQELDQMRSTIETTVIDTNKNGLLKQQYSDLKKLGDQKAAMEKAAKGQTVQQQINARDAIKALQKQIDETNKLTDARLKALDAAKAESDIANQIAKKQAEYDAALATGNSAAAQQASLDIKGLQSTLQYDAQKKALEDSAKILNAPREAAIAALNDGQTKLSDTAALAAEQLSKVTAKYDKQKGAIDTVNTAMTTLELNAKAAGKTIAEYSKTPLGKGMAAQLIAAVKEAGAQVTTTTAGLPEIVNGKPVPTTRKLTVGEIATNIAGTNGLDSKVDIAIKDLGGGKTLADVVAAVRGMHETGVKGVYGAADLKKDNNGQMSLDQQARNRIITNKDLRLKYNLSQKGSTFEYDGVTYVSTGGLNARLVVKNYNGQAPVTKATGGYINHYDNGGGVKGPGTETSDSIPAYLSNGEYVVRAAAVKQYGTDFFDGLNAQKFGKGSKGGVSLRKFALDQFTSLTGTGSPIGALINLPKVARNIFQKYEQRDETGKNINGWDNVTKSKNPETVYLSVEDTTKNAANKKSNLNSIYSAANYLTDLTGINFKVLKPGSENTNKAKHSQKIPIKFATRDYMKQWAGPFVAGYTDGLAPGDQIYLRSAYNNNKFTTHRQGSKIVATHEILHQLGSIYGNGGHSKNPFNIMGSELGINQYVTHKDIEAIRNKFGYYNHSMNPVAQKFHAGGKAGHKHSDENNGWLQKWAKSLEGAPAAEMLGTAALLRKIAGIGKKGDTLSAAMIPLNFLGGGLGNKLGMVSKIGPGASAASHINPVKASTQIMRNLNGSMLESAIANGRKVPTIVPENWWANKANPTPYLEQFKDMFQGTNKMHPLLMASDYGAGFRKYWGRAYDSLVKSKDPSLKGIKNVDEFFRSIAEKTPGWGARYSEDATHPLIEAANKAVMGAHGLAADQPIALFKAAMHQGQAGYSSISSKFARAYLNGPHLGVYRDTVKGTEQGLYKIITEAKKLKDPLGLGGIYDEFANVIPQSLNNAVKIGSGATSAHQGYLRATNLTDFYSALGLGKKGVLGNSTSDLEKILSKMDPAVLASKMKLPKFDNGINNVPADMLAQLHKNEAVVPANMNPFNPNANNATMANSSYTVNNYINGYDGNINELSDIVTRKTITAIKSLNGQSASMVGTSKNVSIK